MERLVAFMEEGVAALVDDVVSSLYEFDPVFREVDPHKLRQGVHQAMRHFIAYARNRETGHLDGAYRFLASLWPSDRLYLSALVRVIFAFEELVAIRASDRYRAFDDFIEDLRMLRATVREALCVFADRFQGRATPAASPRPPPLPEAVRRSVATVETPMVTARRSEPELGRSTSVDRWLERVAKGIFVGRESELQKLWERFRAAAEGGAPEIVGIKAPDGYGKTMLLRTFSFRVERLLKRSPVYLRTQSHRLFSVPLWPFTAMLRGYFGTPLDDRDMPDKVRGGLGRLADFLGGDSADVTRGGLVESAPHLLAFMGDPDAHETASKLDGRTAGIQLRRAMTALIRAVAYRAMTESGAPLFIEIEDAGEMDGGSWRLLDDLLSQIRPPARVMVLLTYSDRFSVPSELARARNFTEISLKPFDMGECEAFVSRMLEPSRIDEGTRLRLMTGAMGSPLLLFEVVRQLVEDGIIGWDGQAWVEQVPLPKEGLIRDLGGVIARRLRRIDPTAAAVLEVVSVVEDAPSGGVLEEVAARRGIDGDELRGAVTKLATVGLIESVHREGAAAVVTRHPLLRDEIYRQMRLERRRAIHEDAGEVCGRLRSARAFPSLAADHMALAGLPARALHGLLGGVDQALGIQNLVGALELCNQALGLLRGFAPADYDRFLFQVLSRRERIHGLLGQRENQTRDQGQLAALAPKVASDAQQKELAEREAQVSLISGRHAEVEPRLRGVLDGAPPGSVRLAHARLLLALSLWQRGERSAALTKVMEAANEAADVGDRMTARLLHAQGRFEAGEGRLPDALRSFHAAWECHQRTGDVYGEALVLQDLGAHFATRGKFIDAARLLLRTYSLLREASEPRALCRVLLELGELHARIGDFESASRFYNQLLQLGDKDHFRLERAAATIGQGRILVHRGRFDEAMRLLGQCLKDLGRVAVRHRIYVDGLNALALALATFSRGEKLTVGALRYAGDAADRATEIGYLRGLVRALCIQVRGLLALGRTPEAAVRLSELDSALRSAITRNPRLERMRAEVEFYRYRVADSRGDDAGARTALHAAWAELQSQVQCLRGSGFEHAFLTNVLSHREIVQALKSERSGGMA